MKRTLVLGGVAVGLLASALVASPAQADRGHHRKPQPKPLVNTNFAAQQVAAFWLGQKMANLINATPYAVETKVAAKHVSAMPKDIVDTKPGVVSSSGDKKASSGSSKNVNLPKTIGKVFFIGADHKPHWCSATAVQSQNKNLVATAGHCVYDTVKDKAMLDKWVFVPGYYNGKTPYGIYVGKTAFTHFDFSTYGDGDFDYAFVAVYNGVIPTAGGTNGGKYASQVYKTKWDAERAKRKLEADKTTGYSNLKVIPVYDTPGTTNNTSSAAPTPSAKIKGYQVVGVKLSIGLKDVGKLGDNVGGQGLAYNQKVGQPTFVFGYPSGSHPDGNYAFSGKTPKYSYGKTFPATAPSIKGEALQGIKSSFTGEGASGSAWLYKYSNATRFGYLNGVTIAVSDTDGNNRYDTSVSPYFDGETLAVYKTAAATQSGPIV